MEAWGYWVARLRGRWCARERVLFKEVQILFG
jgi:hypothetical protein